MSEARTDRPFLRERVARFAPGLAMLAGYRKQDVPRDVVAGLSVAAVALPVSVAYAQLAGFSPVVGLYSSILPLVAYALFGSSRQLIVGPDAATCALIAAAVAPLAAGDASQQLAMSMTLALLTGLILIGASFLKLGALADFLSRPILSGFMSGIALSIALGQMGKLLGFPVEEGGIVPRLLEVVAKLDQVHLPTLAVGVGSFVVLIVSPRLMPRVPAALVAMALAALAVALLGLEERGVHIMGAVPAGLPTLSFPGIPLQELKTLLTNAASIALIAFTSAMLTARSFAAKNGYDVDADRDMAALGAANIAAAVSQGFAVSGADSRTAMNDAAGGRTQVAGLVAAAAIAFILIFLTEPRRHIPQAALGAVLVMAAYSLVDAAAIRDLWREDKGEFAISIIATLGVVALGSVDAIALAVILALLRFVRLMARPMCEVLGEVAGMPGFHGVARHPGAMTIPGLCMFRFNAPLVFFNAPYFKREALQSVVAAGPGLRWFVLDALPITTLDVTGRYTLRELERELVARNIQLVYAGRRTEGADWRLAKGIAEVRPGNALHYPSLSATVQAFQQEEIKSAPE